MIFKLPLSQLETYWKAIKFAAVQAEGVEEINIPAFSLNLLFDIMNEKVICLISVNDQKVIQRILICTINFDSVLQKKILYFKTLYGFEKGMPEDWASESLQVYNFAKKEGCSYISTTSNNEKVIELAKQYGFKQVSVNFSIKL